MRTSLYLCALVAALVLACTGSPAPSVVAPSVTTAVADPPLAPSARVAPSALVPRDAGTRRDDLAETLHGVTVADPYRWLEDGASHEVQAWAEVRDQTARAALAALPHRAQLLSRLAELSYFDTEGAPVHRGTRYFWWRKHRDKEKLVIYWREGEHGAEHVLFDPNTWTADGSASLQDWEVSWDGRYATYSVTAHNSDQATMHVLEVSSGRVLADSFPDLNQPLPSWLPDGSGFYYRWLPPVSKSLSVADQPGAAELRFHRLGSDPARDAIAFPATGDASRWLSGFVSMDGHWLIAVVETYTSTDVYVKDLRRPRAAWAPLMKGADARYAVQIWRDVLYVYSDEGAPRGRVFRVDPRHLQRSAWKEIVAEGSDTLDDMRIAGGHLLLSYMHKASTALEVRDLAGRLEHAIALPPFVSTSSIASRPDEDAVFVRYSSFLSPSATVKASVARGTAVEWQRVTLPFDASPYQVEQVDYPSRDGTSISMFLLRRKDAPRDGNHPTLLYGYGGFSVSITPWFWRAATTWLEAGGIVAVPNLRGGGEYGEAWHRAGMLAEKQHVFDDFIAAARYLIAERWTSAARIGIYGGSNGGLLVGAAMTQAPDLFGAVVCMVPLLDMVRYHQFGAGKTWISEYGSADDAAQFRTLFAYSPYHHVVDGTRYPALLMLSADSDDRVDPLHARKFVAAIEHAGDSPVLLRVDKNAGHGGADTVKSAIEEDADAFAFLMQQLGM